MAKKKKSKKDEFKVEIVDKFDDEDFFDDCPVCQAMKFAQEKGRMPTISELREAHKKAKEKGAIVGGELLEKNDFQMPRWMECTWRRVPCGKDDCPICGRIKRDRQRHIERGEDPDDIKNTIEDVGQSFKEALEIIKKDAESKGFDITNIKNIQEPPKPQEFPLYNKIEEWNKSVRTLENMTKALGEFWLHTEEAADLFWYAHILLARTYRQLCNQWHIRNGDDYGKFDHQYTGYVLNECLEILKKSLKELASNYSQRQELNSIYSNLLKLEKQITKI
ncbi:MAG: hypothetical protein COX44_01480 [Candidatus Portnoybacteria bacterium CG23_combo_of_CG06-09_8_20_14_all_37_13]|uniref:Uncharacterized protein n=1 Tax=Candidatus Portnoybacteria bacterium CG23_combo_of_CG06-09_8_20_14_all_37_13 TaxID=1974819 RepID=A0A2G9YD49_9BACT|nr:MAG: hypothetical protein COX44_01480 [Candidatus Portnoybacteria bacterium CG23_combo_of_CG06-09_8_20_14_all_37_13]